MVVGSEPGWREDAEQRPFVGNTGDELDRYLGTCGLNRRLVYLTNVFRHYWREKDQGPRPGEHYEYGYHELKEELRRVQPRMIITLGREATRFFLGDVSMDETWGLHLKLPEEAHARLDMLRPDVTICPQIHPAAGFHSPEAASQTLVGFENLRRIIQGHVPARGLYDDPYPDTDYRLVCTPAEFDTWADDINAVLRVAADTEGYTRSPWSLQLTKQPGEGAVIKGAEMYAHVAAWLAEAKPAMTMHSALHDIAVMRAQGIDVVDLGLRIDDTMLMAYELSVLPQGLKDLAVRECAMPMLGFMEVMGDAQDRLTKDWLYQVWEAANAQWMALRQEDFDFQTQVVGRKIKVLPKLPKSAVMKAAERCMRAKHPPKNWLDQTLDIQVEAYRLTRTDMPEATLDDVDPEIALRYAGRDPDATHRVFEVLSPRIDEMGLREVYELDLGTLPIIDRMMQTGIAPDTDAFHDLGGLLDVELTDLLSELRAVTGDPTFNPNSGDQCADYLFEKLDLEVLGKKTQTGRGSTNDKVLEALQRMYPEYPQIATLRSYREYYKLRWTFVERLPELIERWPFDRRIHCDLMLNRTPSGRLAAKNPNLLAMPKHGKFAKAFRRCFIPGGRYGERVFLSLDESQVELRVGAHLSQDPVMLAIYRGERRNPDGSKIDLHAAMGERVLGKPAKDQSSADRTAMKAINFGYWMGQTNVGLSLELRKSGMDVDEEDAQRWIDEANVLYAGAVSYKQAKIAEAERNGFIRCLSGRIRYIGGIRSNDDRVRAEAERFAYSTPIQEGAQWIGKQVLTRAWHEVYVPSRRAGKPFLEPVLWTHDDLLSEVEANYALEVAPQLQRIMTTAPEGFSVPLETTPEAGINWADMMELK
jgi:uracil-DNA glycosylase family 4